MRLHGVLCSRQGLQARQNQEKPRPRRAEDVADYDVRTRPLDVTRVTAIQARKSGGIARSFAWSLVVIPYE